MGDPLHARLPAAVHAALAGAPSTRPLLAQPSTLQSQPISQQHPNRPCPSAPQLDAFQSAVAATTGGRTNNRQIMPVNGRTILLSEEK